MTDLYDQRIDAMKARERGDWCFGLSVMKQIRRNAARNITRLAAYKRKRAAYKAKLPFDWDSAHD